MCSPPNSVTRSFISWQRCTRVLETSRDRAPSAGSESGVPRDPRAPASSSSRSSGSDRDRDPSRTRRDRRPRGRPRRGARRPGSSHRAGLHPRAIMPDDPRARVSRLVVCAPNECPAAAMRIRSTRPRGPAPRPRRHRGDRARASRAHADPPADRRARDRPGCRPTVLESRNVVGSRRTRAQPNGPRAAHKPSSTTIRTPCAKTRIGRSLPVTGAETQHPQIAALRRGAARRGFTETMAGCARTDTSPAVVKDWLMERPSLRRRAIAAWYCRSECAAADALVGDEEHRHDKAAPRNGRRHVRPRSNAHGGNHGERPQEDHRSRGAHVPERARPRSFARFSPRSVRSGASPRRLSRGRHDGALGSPNCRR